MDPKQFVKALNNGKRVNEEFEKKVDSLNEKKEEEKTSRKKGDREDRPTSLIADISQLYNAMKDVRENLEAKIEEMKKKEALEKKE